MKLVKLLIIPGIASGDPSKGPYHLANLIHQYLPFPARATVAVVPWWKELQNRQELIEDRVDRGQGFSKLRSVFTGLLGDALAYQPCGGDLYQEVHYLVHQELDHRLSGSMEEPLVIIGHSLGTLVATNYIWDYQNGFPSERPQVMDNLEMLVTLGSPIATCSAKYPNFGTPVNVGKWLNFHHHNDVVSSPLAPLNSLYADRVVDIEAKMPLPWSLTPASHCGYWYSKHVAKIIAQEISKIGGLQ